MDLEAEVSAQSAAAGAGGAAGKSSFVKAKEAAAEAALPWVEKYRPSSLSELVSQAEIINTVGRLIAAGRLPHLLFYGPPGTGKTTTILAIARQLYGDKWRSMTLELNASDDRGIDVVRDQIKSFAGTQKLFSKGVKLVILDEADAMTNDAQFALRRVIEKYSKTTRFCLICNFVSKIIPALQSRCTRFRFAPLRLEDIHSRLSYVAEKEGLASRLQPNGISAILRLANGDMRKVLNVLQATASGFPVIDEDSVYACTGNPRPAEMKEALQSLLKESFQSAYTHLQGLFIRGYALTDIISETARMLGAMKLNQEVRAYLMDKLADIEYRLAFGTSEKLQSASLVAAFEGAKQIMRRHTQAAAAAAAAGGAGAAAAGGAGKA